MKCQGAPLKSHRLAIFIALPNKMHGMPFRFTVFAPVVMISLVVLLQLELDLHHFQLPL